MRVCGRVRRGAQNASACQGLAKVPSVQKDGAPQGVTWFGEDRVRERDMLARWTVAFSFATMAHLREESHLEQDLQARLLCSELPSRASKSHGHHGGLWECSNTEEALHEELSPGQDLQACSV